MIQKNLHPNSKVFHFETPYIGRLNAYTDWVAGGNFDGYIYADVITFYKDFQKVVWEHKVIASFFDDDLPESRIIHDTTYDFRDTRAIQFLGYRGRFLGDNNEFLILDPLDNNPNNVLCFFADLD
jgi:hypothetical protein